MGVCQCQYCKCFTTYLDLDDMLPVAYKGLPFAKTLRLQRDNNNKRTNNVMVYRYFINAKTGTSVCAQVVVQPRVLGGENSPGVETGEEDHGHLCPGSV